MKTFHLSYLYLVYYKKLKMLSWGDFLSTSWHLIKLCSMKFVGNWNDMHEYLEAKLLKVLMNISWYFLSHGGKICVKVTDHRHYASSFVEEWRFPVGWLVWVKGKLITWMSSWRTRSTNETLQDTNDFFRGHQPWKRQWSTTACFSVFMNINQALENSNLRCFWR